MAAVLPCQIIGAMEILYTAESATGVYFFLAELLRLRARAATFNVKKSTARSRAEFLGRRAPLVWYDCACTLHRFMRARKRRQRTAMAKVLAQLPLVVDKFHFRKGHRGCTKGGTCELPDVWPSSHPEQPPCINDSACEQAFGYTRHFVASARNMSPHRALLFLHLLVDSHNIVLGNV